MQRLPVRTALASAMLLAFSGSALAFEFELEDGVKGSWNNTISFGANWRMTRPNAGLYSQPDGARIGLDGGKRGSGGSATDSGNLNYEKGDVVNAPLQLLSDFAISKGDLGAFVRVKAWYDVAMENKDRPYGNASNSYAKGEPLSDSGQPNLLKYSGIALLDAYVYNTFDVGTPLQIRLGNQVVNWGESLFVQGINQLNPVNLPALRKPGTEVKEALLPVWSIDANIALGGGASLEGFYQFKWEHSLVDSCGGYYSPVEFAITTNANPGLGCSSVTTAFYPGRKFDTPTLLRNGFYFPLTEGKDGSNTGQFGVALRLPIDAIDSEWGLYGMRINSRTPIVSAYTGGWGNFPRAIAGNPPSFNPFPGSIAGATAALAQLRFPLSGTQTANGFWEYPDGINIFGTTLSTNIAGWSVGAELGYTPNQPVQINGNDILYSALFPVGPLAPRTIRATAQGAGTYVQGYDRFHKTQLQVNTVKILPSMLGATQGTFIAEIAGQWASNTNDQAEQEGVRYGRAFIFGLGSNGGAGALSTGNTCNPASPLWNPQRDGCNNDGYATSTAWGYRLKASLDYTGAFDTGFTLTPSVFWSHDVRGYSVDSQFIEDRMILGLGLRADYQKKYTIDLGYTAFLDKAKYDPFKDRDYLSLAFSTTF
jgi:hypothetical protein